MKANNTPANLKGMAKHTYNRVMSAMAEDSDPAMLHTFAALTDGAKAIALQSGNFSNLYIRGIHKDMTAEEAANELTERAAALVSRKLRKIDMVCAAAFLAEYISRQRKAAEQPEPTNPDNTPATMNANGTTLTPESAAHYNAMLTPTEEPATLAWESEPMTNDELTALGVEAFGGNDTAPEFSELSHAAQRLDIYLHNTREIYDRYTVPAIKRVAQAYKAGEHVSDNAEQLTKDIQEIAPAISAAARLVRKYDHLTPTAQDIEQVTRNYAVYIVDCAKYEIENA